MSKPYLHYVGHLVSINQSTYHDEEALGFLERLWSNGTSDMLFEESLNNLLNHASEMIHERFKKLDKITEHEIHVASGEVEMWMQSIEIVLSEYYESAQLFNIMGSWIHDASHTLTVIAQGVRLIELVRASPNLITQLGGREKATDTINRGWTLLSRLYNAMKTVVPKGMIATSYEEIVEFFAMLDECSESASKEDLTRLVYSGYVPTGHGLPVGGSGFNIELHKIAKGSEPDQSEKCPTSGWSIGRQGNKEDIGAGRINK